MHHDDEGTLATEKVDEQLQEGVNGEGFVDVPQGIEVERSLEGDDGSPGRGRVDGDHKQDSNDISLEQRLPVVLRLQPN